ncbi:hypothetical protein D3C73_1531560 [compost metagenome]
MNRDVHIVDRLDTFLRIAEMPFPVGRGSINDQRILILILGGYILYSMGRFDRNNGQKGHDNDRDDNPDGLENLVTLLMFRNVPFIALLCPVFHQDEDI